MAGMGTLGTGHDPNGTQRAGKARVLLADDHVLYREGLKRLIEDWDDFAVVGEAGNGLEALTYVWEHPEIDLVLLDICMPVMDGVEAVGRLHIMRPELPVVMLTVSVEEDDIFGALENGAVGYVLKDTPARRLHARLRSVMSGDGVLSSAVATTVIKRIADHPGDGTEPGGSGRAFADLKGSLSSTDLEILRLVKDGASNEEIASTVYMSVPSVKKRLSKYLRIFNVENRVQLAVLVSKMGSLR